MTTLEAMLDAVVEPARPHDPALLDARAAVLATRGVLGARVRARAAAYARAGIEPGTAVAFGVRQDADGIAWLLGAIRAGLAVVVLDPGIAPALLEARCRAAGVEAVVTDGGVA
ncbi:MAG TPA: AMP-binding protein, partial [Candidatus Limnocylindrales bacterium]|nr:AMP-binding protein [Candidatus Limnocylindrales bacterium]